MLIIYSLTTEQKENKSSCIERLLSEISAGDVSAVGRLYDLIKTDVYAFALSKTGNKTDADDIVQDTFIRIYRYAKRYKPMGKPMSWIITLELNIIRRHFQLKNKNVSYEEAIIDKASDKNFENDVINSEFVRQLLKLLSEEEREVITLHIVSGLKHREIAKLLQKPLSTVLSKYNRALKKLNAVVKEGKE